jgi:hypothetical protein
VHQQVLFLLYLICNIRYKTLGCRFFDLRKTAQLDRHNSEESNDPSAYSVRVHYGRMRPFAFLRTLSNVIHPSDEYVDRRESLNKDDLPNPDIEVAAKVRTKCASPLPPVVRENENTEYDLNRSIGDSIVLKSDEFSCVFLRPLPFGDGRRPTAP